MSGTKILSSLKLLTDACCIMDCGFHPRGNSVKISRRGNVKEEKNAYCEVGTCSIILVAKRSTKSNVKTSEKDRMK